MMDGDGDSDDEDEDGAADDGQDGEEYGDIFKNLMISCGFGAR